MITKARKAEYDRQYRAEHSERIKQRRKVYDAAHREERRAWQRQWRRTHLKQAAAQQHRWRDKNRAEYLEYGRRWRIKRSKEVRELINGIKLERGCAHCGYDKDAKALDFHHTLGDKEFNISMGIVRFLAKDRVLEEIKKCQVLCANCHRIYHK